MLAEPLTQTALQEQLQIIPDELWTNIVALKQHKQCVQQATDLHESGCSLRSLLMSLVEWSLCHCTNQQIYTLAPMLSRIEKQMFVCDNSLLLILEVVVTVWETCTDDGKE